MPRRVSLGGVTHEFPDDFTDDEIAEALAGDPGPADPGSGASEIPTGAGERIPLGGGRFVPEAPEHPHARTARLVRENLPAIMAGVGAAASGVGLPAVGMAALGGAGGRGFQITADALEGKGAPAAADAALDMAGSGAIQGATEGVGQAFMAPLRLFSNAIYRGLLGSSSALKDKYGGGKALAATLIREGAPISEGGRAKIAAALDASTRKADDMIAAAAPTAPPIRAGEIISEMKPAGRELRNRIAIGQPSQMPVLSSRISRLLDQIDGPMREVSQDVTFRPRPPAATVQAPGGQASFGAFSQPKAMPFGEAAGKPGGFTPTAARLEAVPGRVRSARPGTGVGIVRGQELKRTAGRAADQALRQRDRGTIAELSADNLVDEGVERGFRRAIERRVPDVADVNARSRELLGAQHALDDALDRNRLATTGGRDVTALVGGGAAAGAAADPTLLAPIALALRALTSPNVGSRAAILMDRTGRVPAVQTGGRLLSTLVSSHDDEQ